MRMYVCVCVSVQNFGAAYRAQKLLDLAEIWYNCSLDEYLGVFFSFFENFHFWARRTRFGPKWTKIFGAAYRAQKLLVPVKFGTLVACVNT